MFGGEYAGAPRMRPREFDCGFHAFTSRRSEEDLRETATGTFTQLLSQFSGKIRNMRLNHCRTAALQFALQRADYIRMVMADVVNAVSGEEVENPPAVIGKEFHSHAALIADVHLQQVEKAHPFRVHSPGIAVRHATLLLDLEVSADCYSVLR